ncbi:adhesion G protein-coupled receptor L4-like [Stylophora pistillata]|uniref:adhesion G protein-coupled receptor L4-like n=1 Tax=Stylophora pistillata TaxID=50429 RepID=UPI000C053429|nr:adhesion G protein-coupled receptor L4-like [Stylophora pistillata]
MPEIHRVYKKLGLLLRRASSGNKQDFYFTGQEKGEYIRIPSRNFGSNGSMLVSIIYTDLHELFKVTRIDRNTRSLNTKIIAAMMDPKQKQLEENVTLTFRNMETTDDERQCVFWKGFNEESLDGWSGEGCHVVTSESNSKETECSCNHLTHFAVLFDYDDAQTITATDQKALEILTYVGLTLSLIGITVTMFSHIFLCDMHQPLSQIRVSLIGSLGAGQVIFLAGFTETRITATCVAVAALMQYFLMAAFCWMMVEGIYLYFFVVKVYNINRKMAIYHAMSWGFPAVMVMISLSIAAGEDGVQSFVNDEYCWMSSANKLIWIFIAFVVIVEVVSAIKYIGNFSLLKLKYGI